MSIPAMRCFIVGGLIVTAAAALIAGPLNPPAGPVASTYKTLSEIEPRIAVNATNTPGDATNLYRITQPGSYYLTGHITGVSGRRGIGISAHNVTLDLNGFRLQGVAGSLDGVNALGIVGSNLQNVEIRNGVVKGWGGAGVVAANTENCILRDLTAQSNGSHGVRGGFRTLVERCTARSNGTSIASAGIDASTDSVIADCVSTNNTGHGFRVDAGTVLERCAAKQNTLSGLSLSVGCVARECVAEGNTQNGILAGAGCVIDTCASKGNTQVGVATGSGCAIVGTNATGNTGTGIRAGPIDGGVEDGGCVISECVGSNNGGFGLGADFGSVVVRSSANTNAGNGIFAGAGSSVRQCTAGGQTGAAGFGFDAQCAATDCSSTFNTAPGGVGTGFEGGDPAQPTLGMLYARCNAYANTAFGIVADSASLIVDCDVSGGTSAGVEVDGESLVLGCRSSGASAAYRFRDHNSRFESNHAFLSVNGFLAFNVGDNNFFVRNSAAQCTTPFVPAFSRPLTTTANPTTANGWDNFVVP